jgi:hypothetical protein
VGGFWGDAWTSFKAVYGPILIVAAFVLALLGPFYAPSAPIQLGIIWLCVVVVVLVIIAMTVGNMLQSARRLALDHLPKIKHVTVDPAFTQGEPDLITVLLERSQLFAPSYLVTINYAERLGNGLVFERQIGIGYVINVQRNGLVQVRVLKAVSNQEELWQRIRNRELSTLAQIVIRPSITIDEVDLGDSVA